jgi:hypothetical protein
MVEHRITTAYFRVKEVVKIRVWKRNWKNSEMNWKKISRAKKLNETKKKTGFETKRNETQMDIKVQETKRNEKFEKKNETTKIYNVFKPWLILNTWIVLSKLTFLMYSINTKLGSKLHQKICIDILKLINSILN